MVKAEDSPFLKANEVGSTRDALSHKLALSLAYVGILQSVHVHERGA